MKIFRQLNKNKIGSFLFKSKNRTYCNSFDVLKAYNVDTRLVQSLTWNSCMKMSRHYIRCVSLVGSLYYYSTVNVCKMCYINRHECTHRYRWGTGEIASSQPSSAYLEFLVSFRSLCVINKSDSSTPEGRGKKDCCLCIPNLISYTEKNISFICSTQLVSGSTIPSIPS